MKECPSDKIYNEATKRCVLKSGKIGKAILAGVYRESKVKKLKKVQNLKKKKETIIKECPSDKIYNEATKRCVLKTGKIGKAILADVYSESKVEKSKKVQNLKKKKDTTIKECPPDKIYNEATKRCVLKTGKIGKSLLKEKQQKKKQIKKQQKKKQIEKQQKKDQQIKNFIQNEKDIKNYINENYDFNPKSVEIVLQENPNLKLFIEYENFFYKKGKVFTKNPEFANNYKIWNNMDQKMTLSEIKNKIEKDNTEDKYDFSKLQSVDVPYVHKIYDSLNSLAWALQSSSEIHVTPSYRFSLPWLIEQHQYIASLPKEERDFLNFYTDQGYRIINDFMRIKKLPDDKYGNISYILPTLEKIYTIVFKKKATLAEIKENIHLLYSIIIQKMNKIIKNSPPLPEDMIVFRGQKINLDTNNCSFLSTSLNTIVGSEFEGKECCKIYIILKKGTHALAAFLVASYNEKEVLLPYDIKLSLIQKKSTKINRQMQNLSSIDVYEASN